MTGGRRDVEADLRALLARDARACVKMLRTSSMTTVDAALDGLVDRAFGDPGRLRDAVDLLGEEHGEAQALLRRAARRAADPQPPGPPRPFSAPDGAAERSLRPASAVPPSRRLPVRPSVPDAGAGKALRPAAPQCCGGAAEFHRRETATEFESATRT